MQEVEIRSVWTMRRSLIDTLGARNDCLEAQRPLHLMTCRRSLHDWPQRLGLDGRPHRVQSGRAAAGEHERNPDRLIQLHPCTRGTAGGLAHDVPVHAGSSSVRPACVPA